MSSSIGGFFELSLNDFGSLYHDEALAFNTGRNALEFILKEKNVRKIFIPYYTCDAILKPIRKLQISFEFYRLNKNLLPDLHRLTEGDFILINNYFGILNSRINSWISSCNYNVILDNSQAFYHKLNKGISGVFYSNRKFFGVPDGAFAYLDELKIENYTQLPQDHSEERFSHLLSRIEYGPENSYKSFIDNEKILDHLAVKRMSNLTIQLSKNIIYQDVALERKKNFIYLHRRLSRNNQLTYLIDNKLDYVPMVYPFLLSEGEQLKKYLISNNIYVATYWPNTSIWLDDLNSIENQLAKNLVPLPIDQRTNEDDLNRIINLILSFHHG